MEFVSDINGELLRSDKYSTLEISLEGDKTIFASARDGSNKKNGVFQRSLVSMAKNWSGAADLIKWYDGDNNEPEFLMRLISDNPTLLGLLLTKCTILHGEGLKLYRVADDGTKNIVPYHKWPEPIQEFYDYNDLDSLTYQMFCDLEMLGNFFPRISFTVGSSMVKKKVAKIERISPDYVRAYKPAGDNKPISQYGMAAKWQLKDKKPGSFSGDKKEEFAITKIKAYQKDDFYNDLLQFDPFKTDHSAILWHGKREIPGYPCYSIPHWYGARFHIELQNEIPRWHIANIINQWGARVKVSINHSYIKAQMALTNPKTSEKYTEKEVKTAISEMIRDLFTNPENVGKTMLSGHLYDPQGKLIEDIIIDTIKVDTKDDAYTALEDVINNKITSSVGVQAALAALVMDNKGLSSGSEQTQAWNIEAAKAKITQKLILKPLQFIHKYNQWDKDLVWDFPSPSLVTKDINPTGMVPPPTQQ